MNILVLDLTIERFEEMLVKHVDLQIGQSEILKFGSRESGRFECSNARKSNVRQLEDWRTWTKRRRKKKVRSKKEVEATINIKSSVVTVQLQQEKTTIHFQEYFQNYQQSQFGKRKKNKRETGHLHRGSLVIFLLANNISKITNKVNLVEKKKRKTGHLHIGSLVIFLLAENISKMTNKVNLAEKKKRKTGRLHFSVQALTSTTDIINKNLRLLVGIDRKCRECQQHYCSSVKHVNKDRNLRFLRLLNIQA
ncbi:hypothetical protein WN51_03880 [Melipona quadrifasciata]|uniref:Uncharacterized protein n=1 Tax=Melipona quadrifasciata TaxID=166423 RepID=A0A0N0BKM7_9HYME|nr:hypothetical protein WN51_03880 [Melipona quadrifasciata]